MLLIPSFESFPLGVNTEALTPFNVPLAFSFDRAEELRTSPPPN